MQRDPAGFFGITYPSVDLLKCLESIAPGQERSVVLMGGRGQGKSHMMAAVYHALTSPSSTKAWLDAWAPRLQMPHLAGIKVRPGLRVIAETLSNQAYPTLWDLLFQEHANGQFFRGKFEASSVPVPSKALLIDMFTEQATGLLLDEFQTWFDGLSETRPKPLRTRAFNFIQTLSEIAAEYPDKLLLIVSVRDGQTDAYQQLHRINPRVVGALHPVLTAADFRIDLPGSAVGSLLDAVASPLHRTLREKAQKNLESVLETVPNAAAQVPHAAEIISALWLRSFNTERHAGASLSDLQLDITRDKPLDDNLFGVEIKAIRESSFNIHEQVANWLVFKNDENPDARLMANARNDRLFPAGEDHAYLARFIHAMLAADEASPYRVVVLRRFWQKDPWVSVPPEDHPDKWCERIPVVVVPEGATDEAATLGRWLRDNLTSSRNTVRFLLPPKDSPSIYQNPELILAARAAKLAMDWQASEPEYRKLRVKYDKLLEEQLKGYFHRFAVLDRWHHADPSKCVFQFAGHGKQGAQIPRAMQEATRDTLFLPDEFEALVLDFAQRSESVGKLLDELKEPRSGGNECIAWLGERDVVDRVEILCAKGKIAINLRGIQLVQALPGDSEMAVAQRIKGKIGSGNHLYSTTIQKLSPGGHVGGGVVPTGGTSSVTPPVTPPAPAPVGPSGGGTAPNPFTTGTGTAGTTTFNETPKSTHLTSPRNSALNLTGTLETWGANKAAVTLRNITLRLDDMNGAQLAETLKKLPPGSYSLDLDKEIPE